MCINLGTFFGWTKLVTLFCISVHNVGLEFSIFLTFWRVAKLTLDIICFKQIPIFSVLLYHFPNIGPIFFKIAPILSLIFLVEATWSLVSLAAVFWKFLSGERCVTSKKTAARETTWSPASLADFKFSLKCEILSKYSS